MKRAVEIALSAMTYKPSLINIGSDIRKLIRGYTYRHRHTYKHREGKVIS
jgi:hypothetical protein